MFPTNTENVQSRDQRAKHKLDRKQRVFHRVPDPLREPSRTVAYARQWRPSGGAAAEDPYDFRAPDTLAEALKKIPYVVCALSAGLFGIYDDLKAAGRPLSADAEAPVDLAAYVKEGYAIYVY